MAQHRIVSREEWLNARKVLLAEEKQLTRLRDELSRKRRELPWVKVDKNYTFESASGKETLADLFDGRSQLVIVHFMFDPNWDEGCKMCSFMADHYNPSAIHVRQRDIALVVASSAPWPKLDAFKKRMGWSFKWVSSGGSDFNRDYHVTFTPEEKQKGEVFYNFTKGRYFSSEGPGISVFIKDDGAIYHTYSCYGRGVECVMVPYDLIDMTPKGRDEAELPYGMAWVRFHDRYED